MEHTEDTVSIHDPRARKAYEEIHNGRQPEPGNNRRDTSDDQGGTPESSGTERINTIAQRRNERREERAFDASNSVQGVQSRVRPPDRADSDIPKSASSDSGKVRRPSKDAPAVAFDLKGIFKSKAPSRTKVYSESEADSKRDKIYQVYYFGSSLLDDALQIITKDHEEVQIWQLSEEEADTLVEMHLYQAQHDVSAARSADKLVEIYDRMYKLMLAWPRFRLSISYVKEHGGLSFK